MDAISYDATHIVDYLFQQKELNILSVDKFGDSVLSYGCQLSTDNLTILRTILNHSQGHTLLNKPNHVSVIIVCVFVTVF